MTNSPQEENEEKVKAAEVATANSAEYGKCK